MIIQFPGEQHTETVRIHGRTCPVCGRDHSVFMRRTHFFVIFLLVFAHSIKISGPICTRCVRRLVFERAWFEMLAMNLLWPFFFCLSEIPQFVFSLVKDAGARLGMVLPMDMGGEVWNRNWLFAFLGTVFSASCGIGLLVLAGFLISYVEEPWQFWGSLLILWLVLFCVGMILRKRRASSASNESNTYNPLNSSSSTSAPMRFDHSSLFSSPKNWPNGGKGVSYEGEIAGLAVGLASVTAAVLKNGEFYSLPISDGLRRCFLEHLSGEGHFTVDDAKQLKALLEDKLQKQMRSIVMALPSRLSLERRNGLFRAFAMAGMPVERFIDWPVAAALAWTFLHPRVNAVVSFVDHAVQPDEAVVAYVGDEVCSIEAIGTSGEIRKKEASLGSKVSREEDVSPTGGDVRRGAAVLAANLQKKAPKTVLLLEKLGAVFGLMEGENHFQTLLEASASIPTKNETDVESLPDSISRLTPGFLSKDGIFIPLAQTIEINRNLVPKGIAVIVEADAAKNLSLSLWNKSTGRALCAYAIDQCVGSSLLTRLCPQSE